MSSVSLLNAILIFSLSIFIFRYAEAKRLGEQVNTSRQKISTLLSHQHLAFAVDYFN